MTGLKLELECVSPMFIHGADTGRIELRAASFRGALRYWLRALLGGRYGSDLAGLATAEEKVFGSTGMGSPVVVRVQELAPPQERPVFAMLPHRSSGGSLRRPAVEPRSRIELSFQPRLGQRMVPSLSQAALVLLLSLGGVGQRARRGFGSLCAADPNLLPKPLSSLLQEPADGAALTRQISGAVNWAVATAFKGKKHYFHWRDMPSFPVISPRYCQVAVCEEPFPTYEKAMVDLFQKVLRQKSFRDYEPAFGSGDPRRASPLHVHIAKSNRGFHLVLTAFRAEPSLRGDKGWAQVYKALVACAKEWQGRRAYGQKGAWK